MVMKVAGQRERMTMFQRVGAVVMVALAAMLPEAEFYAAPWSPGDTAHVGWRDAHALHSA